MQIEDQGLIAGRLFHSGASEGLGAGGLLETRHRQTTTIPRPGRVCSGVSLHPVLSPPSMSYH